MYICICTYIYIQYIHLIFYVETNQNPILHHKMGPDLRCASFTSFSSSFRPFDLATEKATVARLKNNVRPGIFPRSELENHHVYPLVN